MKCDNHSPTTIEATIDKNIVSVGGVEISDALHNYSNEGQGRGVLLELNDKSVYFAQTDLNTNLIHICDIFINNLQFTATSTDPLALEIKNKLELIKQQLETEKAKIP